jgi:hypothetical protein
LSFWAGVGARRIQMSRLRYSVSMSIDGFVAGPEQSREHPLGLRGELLHQ